MLVTEVRACIEAHAMLASGAKVIVAVSGGADSTALLSLMVQLRPIYDLTLIVAHVNHQLRGDEAEREAVFVEQQAMILKIPFYQTRLDVVGLQRTSGLSMQQAARQLRYQFFEHLCRSLDATCVALGHNADDQAETLLLRLLRGSGPTGLAGMPAVREPFIRPLLAVSRRAIFTYLQIQCIPWVEDSSNAHAIYLRNRVRQHVIPLLQQFNPQIVRRFNELTDMLRADNDVLERQVDIREIDVCTWKADKIVNIHCLPFRMTPLAIQRRLLRRVLAKLSISGVRIHFRHIEALRQYIGTEYHKRRLGLPEGIFAERHVGTVRMWNVGAMPPLAWSHDLPLPGVVDITALNIRLCTRLQGKSQHIDMQAETAFIDFERLVHPLRVRFWQPGDRFFPLGSPGSKKLQDFYIDSRVPYGERPYLPLVVSGQDIVWVVGHRIAEPFKMRPETTRVVRLHCCAIY